MPDVIEDICREVIGQEFENLIRKKIMSNVPPPNAPTTIKAKGSSTTLIDTTNMITNVSNQVENRGSKIIVTAGIFDEEVAGYAAANEYGVSWEKRPRKKEQEEEEEAREWFIPPRSFIRSTFDENIDGIVAEFDVRIHEYAFKVISKI
jgi:hypothetical protein